jgi:hypothetical protein
VILNKTKEQRTMTRERFKANIRKPCLPSKWPFLDEVIDPIFDQQDKLEAELKAKGDEIAKAKKGLDDLKQEVECHRKRGKNMKNKKIKIKRSLVW